MGIKGKIKQLALKAMYGYYDSDSYSDWLRKKGVTIGEGTKFYGPFQTSIDVTRPYGITIGKNVHITRGVTVLTHGFDWAVVKGLYDDVLGSFGEVVIGDNCFIGSHAMILKGARIPDNTIIGASSVVNKSLPQSGVYVGNPARYVCSIEEYYEKRINAQLAEAKEQFLCYYRKYGKTPPKKELNEFFFLFEDRSCPLEDNFRYQMNNNGAFDACLALYKSNHRKIFDNYEAFAEHCLRELSKE